MGLLDRIRKAKPAERNRTEKQISPAAPTPPADTTHAKRNLRRTRSHDAHTQVSPPRASWSLTLRRRTRRSVIPAGTPATSSVRLDSTRVQVATLDKSLTEAGEDGGSSASTRPASSVRAPVPHDILAIICDLLESDNNRESRATLASIMGAGRWGYHVAARALYRTVDMGAMGGDQFWLLIMDLEPATTNLGRHECVHCGTKGSPDPSCIRAPIGKVSLLAYTRHLIIDNIGFFVHQFRQDLKHIDKRLGKAMRAQTAAVGASRAVWKETRPPLFPSVQFVTITAKGYMVLQDVHTHRTWDCHGKKVESLITPPHDLIRFLCAEASPTTLNVTLPTAYQMWSHIIHKKGRWSRPTLFELDKYFKLHTTTKWIEALIKAWPLEPPASSRVARQGGRQF